MIKVIHNVTDSVVEVLVIFLLVILVSGLAFSFIEGETLFRSIYWATITATSVGYGDISPKTSAGMVLAIVTAISGLVAMALFIAKVHNVLVRDDDKFAHDEQEQMKKQLNRIERMINEKE